MSIDTTWLQSQFPELTTIQPLNVGGQKSVFTADHENHGRIVLKLFHLGTDVQRAMREVEAVSEIQSSRVPKILHVGDKSSPTGRVMWVWESYIEGETLREMLIRRRMETHEILTLGMHILEALDAAEKVRIVHRDVKPENIMVGSDGSGWLLDFGLARHLDRNSLTVTGPFTGVVGTPGYSPPEQFNNQKPDQDSRTDLFALGVTLYECIEGNNPYRAGARDPYEMLRRIETDDLPRISRKLDAQDSLGDLILSMTRRQRNHRPRTVQEALGWIRDVCPLPAV
ncbi:MAG: serine/threonine protein kinase [Pyrinomonadaceae bacterium]|nr:serine/threonine protein kinase [Pyrinomonadaceae bacterium]